MSLFRKPKPKRNQRRVASTFDESDECEEPATVTTSKKLDTNAHKNEKKNTKEQKEVIKPKALLSFAEEEDDDEVFQVRKSSHSKKVMRMMDKERRKKKKEDRCAANQTNNESQNGNRSGYNGAGCYTNNLDSMMPSTTASSTNRTGSSSDHNSNKSVEYCNKNSKKTDSIQTEIRTDDFVLVVKKSEPELILNGRAALCAGRDDMFEEDENDDENDDDSAPHRFTKPEKLKEMLESGSIPDAAMIHAARKRRQKAREQGDYIPIEEPKEVTKRGSRLALEDVEGDNSDEEERMDMNAITGFREREERREQFYSVQNEYSDGDSDHEMDEWESQQIRKGVTGAQLVSAQQESVLSRFIIKSSVDNNEAVDATENKSTSMLLEQAYAKTSLERSQQVLGGNKVKKVKPKTASLRTPQEIRESLSIRLEKLKELNSNHFATMERITNELEVLKFDEMDCNQKAPAAAAKYRFYQEIKCYITDLVDCLNEKFGCIIELEKRVLHLFSKHQNFLIERRRQDVRDQVKEMADASKQNFLRRGAEHEEQVRRAAEREGRRTRRRCERERNDLTISHLDGMSSDDETSDRYQEQFQNTFESIDRESLEIFDDVNDEFCKIDFILKKFVAWRKCDMETYKDAFVSLCLPKIVGPVIRIEMLTWSPLSEEYKELEKMLWYPACMLYAYNDDDDDDNANDDKTVEEIRNDPDVNFVPAIIEKIIIPKVTEIVSQCWDPLSTTQTLRLIGFINRLGRDYPLKETTKSLQQLFKAILEKMKLALEMDAFIPIFPNQVQEAKTSFFQRQFCSCLKLFRNFLSWQGIIADEPLRSLAIANLLNRYLLLAMRVCSPNDAIGKGYIIVNTLPTVWLLPDSATLKDLEYFITFIKQTLEKCDVKNPLQMQSCEKAKQILQRLHSSN